MDTEPEPVSLHRPNRTNSAAISDGYDETISHPEVEPEDETDDLADAELDELGMDNETDEADLPLSVVDEAEIPDVDFAAPEIEEEDEELFDDDEEDEEDLGWSGRGRKKPKPGRQVKPPKKTTKRDPRRGF
ncbi:MAG: hypothetical protein ACJ788_03385 [Ktedonobacteraceae bacterium]